MAQGYGVEIWCYDQIRTGRLARGRQVLAQALYHRLITPRGTLRGGEEESTYGFDVAGYLGAVGSALALRSLPSQVEAELKKDDRVVSVGCTATLSTDPSGATSIILEISVVPDDESGDFTLTLAVTAVTATLLGGIS